jgi:hypothetical protein
MQTATETLRAELKRRLIARRIINRKLPAFEGSHCWDYCGAQEPDGYGRIKVGRRALYVHRVSAFVWKRLPLDSALFVRHRCHNGANKACFNPLHLSPDTQAENNRDTVRDKRWRNDAITDRMLRDLIQSARRGKITIGKWAVVKGVAYSTALQAYNGRTHTARSAELHQREDQRQSPRIAAPNPSLIDPSRYAVTIIPDDDLPADDDALPEVPDDGIPF